MASKSLTLTLDRAAYVLEDTIRIAREVMAECVAEGDMACAAASVRRIEKDTDLSVMVREGRSMVCNGYTDAAIMDRLDWERRGAAITRRAQSVAPRALPQSARIY